MGPSWYPAKSRPDSLYSSFCLRYSLLGFVLIHCFGNFYIIWVNILSATFCCTFADVFLFPVFRPMGRFSPL